MALLLLAGMLGFQPVDSADQLDFLRVSYKANKDAFAFGTFRFEYTRGSCANLSDAESGVFSKAVREQGFYVFEGKNARYDLVASLEDIANATTSIGEDKTSSFAWTYRMLTDGKTTLLDFLSLDKSTKAFNHAPEIYASSDFFYRDIFFQFPLWLGANHGSRYDLFHNLTEIQEGRASLVELDFDTQLDGLRVCKLSHTYKGGKCTYWIDLNRGSVPLRIEKRDDSGRSASIFLFSDLEHIAGAGWLPRRRLHVFGDGTAFDRIAVTSIDVKNKPPSSAFQLDFPEAVRLVDGPRGLVYSRGKTWSLLKLPEPSSPGTQRIQKSAPRSFEELPGEVEAGTPWTVIVAAVLGLFLVVGAFAVVKIRRRRARGVHDV